MKSESRRAQPRLRGAFVSAFPRVARRRAFVVPWLLASGIALAQSAPKAAPDAKGTDPKAAAAAPTPRPTPTVDEIAPPLPPERENWRVGIENAVATFRSPNTQAFAAVPSDGEVPEGSTLFVKIPTKGKARVRVVHKGGRMIEVATTTIIRLASSELNPGDRPFRIALDDLPSNIETDEPEEGMTSLDRLISYFVPRVPLTEAVVPQNLAKRAWVRNPIRPTFPGQVHLIEAETVPAIVNFEWPVQGGQQEPHNFYLWMDGRYVHAPHEVVRGGRISVTLSRFGKYFWQVEDKTGQYASSPRIIYVRRPGESLEEGVRPEATPTPEPGTEVADEGPDGTFQLKSPRKKSVVLVCLTDGPRPLIPLVVPNAVTNAKRYIVDVKPKLGEGRWVFERVDDRLAFETGIPATRLGNFTFTVRAVIGGPKDLEVLGDETPVRVSDVCAGKRAAGQGAFAEAIQRGAKDPFPEAGATVLLAPGGEP